MSIRKNKILPFYNSKTNDILEEFYVPLLCSCTEYKRVSAYFDSHILELYSAGVENIVRNNGHISFIFSCEITEKDFELMVNGYKNRESIEQMLLDKSAIDNPSIDFTNLAFLIKHGFVDIKIAFTKEGIFHDKYGLIFDGDDAVYFRGSNNETVASIKSNYESFETSTTWNSDSSEKSKIQNAIHDFELLWNNNFDGTVVVDIPDVVKNQIIQHSGDKLILAYQNKEGSFVFDLENNNLVGFNNIEYPTNLYLSSGLTFYNTFLGQYIDNIENSKYKFKKDLSYVVMKEIIARTEELGEKKGFSIYVSPSLRSFLLNSDIQINKRRSLGQAIKARSPLLLSSFNAFKQKVDSLLTRELREPQMWDAYHIVEMMRSANFSVPGAGKTSIVYGAFAYLFDKKEVDKIVMIGPINSFMAWKKEFHANFGNKLEMRCYDYQLENASNAADRYDHIVYRTKDTNLFLINYDALMNNEDALKEIINSKTLLVFDEVHRIKSTTGKKALSALSLCKRARYRVVLTGTPIPNGYIDIFNFLHILFEDEYDTFFNFSEQYLKEAKSNEEYQQQINDKLYPFFCRTTKKDLNVPPPNDDDVTSGFCQFDSFDEELFGIVYRRFRYNTLLLYVRLMQASSNPSLLLNAISDEDLHSFDTDEEDNDFSALLNQSNKKVFEPDEEEFIKNFGMTKKFWKTLDLIENIVNKNKPVVVWGIFVDTLNKLFEECKNRNISTRIITGSVPPKQREQIIKDFLDGKFSVLITNPHTLAESVSLHTICHDAIYLEYSFNLVHMLQSRDRIHRLGLVDGQETNYYYMMLDNGGYLYNSIDRKIYDRLKDKEELQNNAIEGHDLVYYEEDIQDDIDSLDLI